MERGEGGEGRGVTKFGGVVEYAQTTDAQGIPDFFCAGDQSICGKLGRYTYMTCKERPTIWGGGLRQAHKKTLIEIYIAPKKSGRTDCCASIPRQQSANTYSTVL